MNVEVFDRGETVANLQNKVAVVTGASKGIGAGIAKALGAAGASVVVNYASDKAGADRVVEAIKAAGGRAIAVGGSVNKEADSKRLIETAVKEFGKLDILVNNAGVYAFSPITELTEEHIDWIFGVNVKGLLFASREAAKVFPAEGGNIINIGSVVSEITPAYSSVYSGTKGAVDAITRVLAKELGPKKIRVNAVNPGLTATEGNVDFRNGSDFEVEAVKNTPLGRVGEVDEIADAVVFLATEEARWVTGSLLQVAGGLRS